MEISAKAFWSYAHSDNEREKNRVLRLADLLTAEYEVLTGTTIEIFTDKAEIRWGEDFRDKLDEALQETTFFIPILSPTYFLRDECRGEMSQFVRSATALGLDQLLLSVRYVPVPDLREESADELKAVAARMQFEPWDHLRLLDEGSSEHRAAVHRLASRLVDLTRQFELGAPFDRSSPDNSLIGKESALGLAGPKSHKRAVAPPQLGGDSSEFDDDSPGLLDLVADAQPAMEAWTRTIAALSPATERFNWKFQSATEQMNTSNKQPNSFARKIVIARELASEVEPDLQEIEQLSKEYSAGLLRVDSGTRAILELAEVATDAEAVRERKTLHTSLRELIGQSRKAMETMSSAANAARANAKLSRDLRPVLRRYETAARNIVDGFQIIDGWESLLGRSSD